MGLFNSLKKRKKKTLQARNNVRPTEFKFTVNLTESDLKGLVERHTDDRNFSHLDENGELPFGWIYHNQDFVEKIHREFNYFLNAWINVRGKGGKQEYAALKSLILYVKDAEQLCAERGECFSKWFSDCIADHKYISIREAELEEVQKTIR